MPNLYLAGDFCDNRIGLTSIEAGVITGLEAARAIVQRRGRGRPVEIIEPADFPAAWFAWLRVAWAPYAAAAKIWSTASDVVGGAGHVMAASRAALRYLFGPTRPRRQR